MLNLYETIKEIEKEYTKDYIQCLEEIELQTFLETLYNIDYVERLKQDYEYKENSLYFYIFVKYKEEETFNRYCFTLSKISPKRKTTCPVSYILYRLGKIEGFNLFITPNIFYKIHKKNEEEKDIQGAKNDLVCISNTYYIDIDDFNEDISTYDFKKINNYLHKTYNFIDLIYPTIIVKSGGGLHLYFKTFETEDIYKSNQYSAETRNKHNQIERILVSLFNADVKCKNLSRMLRVPFSFNYKAKYKEPRKIEIFFTDYYREYNDIEYTEFLCDFKEELEITSYSQDDFYNNIFNDKLIKSRVSEIIKSEIQEYRVQQTKHIKWNDLEIDLMNIFDTICEDYSFNSLTCKNDKINYFNKLFNDTCKKYFASYRLLSTAQKNKYKRIYKDCFINVFNYNPYKKQKTENKTEKKKSKILISELEFYRENGKQAAKNLSTNRIKDLEDWFYLHLNNMQGYRNSFFFIYINLKVCRGVDINVIEKECINLYNKLKDKNDFYFEQIEIILKQEKRYRFYNTTIAEMLNFTEEEKCKFRGTYTKEEIEINKQNNIDKQNKKKLDILKTNRENKWETIKNILLQNENKTNKELIDLLFLALNKQVTDRTLRNYKKRLNEEIYCIDTRNIA